MTSDTEASRSAARRIALLAAQAFALGLLMSWILIPASAIFLGTYGPGLLPVTYLGAAVAGVLSSSAVSRALRRRSLVTTALRVLAGVAGALVVTWALLAAEVRWLSFGLLVLAPIVVPMGFMFLVGQAGMLLDVRALKALYARVIAGFALGFVAGGLVAPALLSAVGRTEHLVLGAAVAAGLWMALLVATRRQFRSELSAVEHDVTDPSVAPTWRDLLRHRFVALIVAFQMLSAIESQWLDYLVYERATGRYEDTQELAGFISRFTAIAYGADIVFLLLIAGLLLRRFGLRYGLTANPAVVLALVGGVVALSSLQGAGATMVFVLIVAARVCDLVLADGAARTSLSAAYQVVPTPVRLAAQTGVEGLAVPLAIGLSGVVLLGLQATTGTDGPVLPILVGAVVATWLVVALLVHRSYRGNLLTSLRYRTLDPSTLSLDDANRFAVADRLLESSDVRDVRLGLDTLAQGARPGVGERLDQLTLDARAMVRADALDRLPMVDPALALAAARRNLDDRDAAVRATAARVLASVGEPSDLPAVEAHRNDEDADVQAAVLNAIAQLGDDEARRHASAEVARLAASSDARSRMLAAQVLGASAPVSGVDRQPLQTLIDDADDNVAIAALGAVHPSEDRGLLDQIARALGRRATAAEAGDALVRFGEAALALVDEGLADSTLERRARVHLARIGRDIGGSAAAATLGRHIGHPDRELGLAVLSSLAALTSAGDGVEEPDTEISHVVLTDVEHATRTLRALCVLADHPGAGPLRGALRDELGLLRRRVRAGLAVRYGEDAMERVSFQLARADSRAHALAMEWLDVTLVGTDRSAISLLEPGLSERGRLHRLTRALPLADQSPSEVLHDLVLDADHRWRQPWVRACALYAASMVPELAPFTDLEVSGEGSSIIQETAAALRARSARQGAQL